MGGYQIGGLLKLYPQFFPSKPKWGVDDIPDLTGKVMLVTGTCSKLKTKK
jgi:retinol dehydrogenase 12